MVYLFNNDNTLVRKTHRSSVSLFAVFYIIRQQGINHYELLIVNALLLLFALYVPLKYCEG